jgi:hypothetical protein
MITLAVTQWNKCNNLEAKKYARSLLQGELTTHVARGTGVIIDMIDQGLKKNEFTGSLGSFGCSILPSIVEMEHSFEEMPTIQDILGQIALYFLTMFKAGHFEQLPMPEFGYEMPASAEERVHVSKRNSKLNTLAYRMAGGRLGEDENPGQGQEDPN